MTTAKYTLTIAFNYGRDESSRKVVSTHSSPRAALVAFRKSQNDNGWSPRIDCLDAAACNALFAAAKKFALDARADDYRRAAETATVLT